MWFAGVHGDIGGQCRADDRLPDIAFSWMVKEADRAGFHVDKAKYRRLVKVDFNKELPTNWRSALSVLTRWRGVWLAAGVHARFALMTRYIPASATA
jgi:hypothetical protein